MVIPMKWSLQQLYRYINEPLIINEKVNYDEYVKNVSDIIRMDDVLVEGTCKFTGNDCFVFNLKIKTTMYLEDAWTLEEVEFPIDLDVKEVFAKDSDDEDSRFIEKNTVDLYDIIWENVLLEKPICITKSKTTKE